MVFLCRLAKIPTEVVSIVVAFIIFFVGANYLMEVIVDKFPLIWEEKGAMRNGFSNTFTSSCREHAHLLNTADFNSFRIFSNEAIVNIGLEGTMVIGALAQLSST